MEGQRILEASGFTPAFALENLPAPEDIDERHRDWRELVRNAATELFGYPGSKFSHGVAAKLINSYLKARFVCGGLHADERVMALHPPIDAVLLKGLADANFGNVRRRWIELHEARWSKFDANTYQQAINLIRETLGKGVPLWKIEAHWQGYQ